VDVDKKVHLPQGAFRANWPWPHLGSGCSLANSPHAPASQTCRIVVLSWPRSGIARFGGPFSGSSGFFPPHWPIGMCGCLTVYRPLLYAKPSQKESGTPKHLQLFNLFLRHILTKQIICSARCCSTGSELFKSYFKDIFYRKR
jgi:hypothetical protein